MLKVSLVAFAAAGFSVLPLIPCQHSESRPAHGATADLLGRSIDEAIGVLGVPRSTSCSGGSFSLVYDGFRVVSHADRVVLIDGVIGDDHVPEAAPESAPHAGQSVAAFCACVPHEPTSCLVQSGPALEVIYEGGWHASLAHGRLMRFWHEGQEER